VMRSTLSPSVDGAKQLWCWTITSAGKTIIINPHVLTNRRWYSHTNRWW
jgi:hypothetical protein